MRRLDEQFLRKMIREEIDNRRSLSSLLFEQGSEDAADNADAKEGGSGDKIETPWVNPEEEKKLKEQGPNQKPGKGVNGSPDTDINMLTTDPETSFKTAMELLKYGRSVTSPKCVIDTFGFAGWKGEADGAKWLKSIGGPGALKARIAKIQSGQAGLVPRADMPVLFSKETVDVKDPKTGETVASGAQDVVAGELLQKGAIDAEPPYAKTESKMRTARANYARAIRSIKESVMTKSYIISEFCRINGLVISEQDNPFPTNLTDKDKDEYLTKGFRDSTGADDADKKALPVNLNATPKVSELAPSQADVYLAKALGFAFGKKYDGDPIVIAGDKVLDGHHRWAAANLADPSFNFKGIQIGTKDTVDTALKALRSIGNAMGNKQQGAPAEEKKESVSSKDAVIMERWQRLAGILKD